MPYKFECADLEFITDSSIFSSNNGSNASSSIFLIKFLDKSNFFKQFTPSNKPDSTLLSLL
ncbi:hypothetical protein BpHYR1_040774 [Brachionus plicatilis]|uniref:Uncharacterized protein n=1 Tax=Brachionus plicatilis TaxID=10195 RepID=A0A3M7P689_BRAPC|nr:hypothetical protein BpHYR1_040774 [Brachionus plicatilis]